MTKFQAKTDRKQISIILNLIKIDCADLYRQFRTNKIKLKQAIELYEEFATEQINVLFQNCNNFSDVVKSHRKKFQEFRDEISQQNDEIAFQPNGAHADDDIYVIFISLQPWLIEGPKCGQQFYFMIDIDSFQYARHLSNGLRTVIESENHFRIIRQNEIYIFCSTGNRNEHKASKKCQCC